MDVLERSKLVGAVEKMPEVAGFKDALTAHVKRIVDAMFLERLPQEIRFSPTIEAAPLREMPAPVVHVNVEPIVKFMEAQTTVIPAPQVTAQSGPLSVPVEFFTLLARIADGLEALRKPKRVTFERDGRGFITAIKVEPV